MTHTKLNPEIIQDAIDKLNDGYSGTYACDLHNELFNTDYYIIGYYDAEQWLIKNVGIFNAIEEIREYEMDNFGSVNTDLSSSEHVVNMYVYIQGELILAESKTLQKVWDKILTDEDIAAIKEELEELL